MGVEMKVVVALTYGPGTAGIDHVLLQVVGRGGVVLVA